MLEGSVPTSNLMRQLFFAHRVLQMALDSELVARNVPAIKASSKVAKVKKEVKILEADEVSLVLDKLKGHFKLPRVSLHALRHTMHFCSLPRATMSDQQAHGPREAHGDPQYLWPSV